MDEQVAVLVHPGDYAASAFRLPGVDKPALIVEFEVLSIFRMLRSAPGPSNSPDASQTVSASTMAVNE